MVSLVYHMYYSYTLLAISCAGVFSNVASIILVGRQRFRKMFHRLMLILAVYDLMVSQSLNLFCLHYKKLPKYYLVVNQVTINKKEVNLNLILM